MEYIQLSDIPEELRVELLRELGYETDGTFIYDSEGNIVYDKYTGDPVFFDNMAILPGSVIIIDSNPLSFAEYLEEQKKLHSAE